MGQGSLTQTWQYAALTHSEHDKKDNKESWIKTGRNLERILLYLTSEDISHAYFNSIVESDKHRIELGKELNNGLPQLVLRLGKAKRVQRATRSAIKEVLMS